MLDENLSRTFWSTINSTIRHRDQPVFLKNIFPWMILSSSPYKRYQVTTHGLLWKRCLTFNKVLLIFSPLGWVWCRGPARLITISSSSGWQSWAGFRSAGCLSFFLSWKPTKNAESRFSVSIIPMWQFSVQFFIYVVTHGDVNPGVRGNQGQPRVTGINQKLENWALTSRIIPPFSPVVKIQFRISKVRPGSVKSWNLIFENLLEHRKQ